MRQPVLCGIAILLASCAPQGATLAHAARRAGSEAAPDVFKPTGHPTSGSGVAAEPPPSSPDMQASRPGMGARPAVSGSDEPASKPNEPPAPPVDETGTAASPHSGFVELDVADFQPAVVYVPEPNGAPQPVLVAVHGAGGEAQWHCELWRKLTLGRGYILCPQGSRMHADPRVSSGYYYPDHHHLEREVMAAVNALWARYPHADRQGLVYAGYSQGATMGALMVVRHGDVFARLALIEGGSHEWNVTLAQEFHQGGGQRVLFACGRHECDRGARISARWLKQGGIEARVEYARGAGHTPAGAVTSRVARALPWLLGDDPRW